MRNYGIKFEELGNWVVLGMLAFRLYSSISFTSKTPKCQPGGLAGLRWWLLWSMCWSLLGFAAQDGDNFWWLCGLLCVFFLQLRSTSSHRCQAAGCWKKARQARCLELKVFFAKISRDEICRRLQEPHLWGESSDSEGHSIDCNLRSGYFTSFPCWKSKAESYPHRSSQGEVAGDARPPSKVTKCKLCQFHVELWNPACRQGRSEGRDPFIVKVKFTQKGRKLLLLDSKLEFCLFNLRIKPFGWLGENSIWSTSWKRWSIPWIAAFEIIFDDTTSPPSVFKLWHCAVNEGGTKDVPKRLKQMSPLLAKYVPFLQGEKQYEKMNTRMSKMRCYILWWLSMIPLSCVVRHALSQRSACRHPQGSH